jgi:hypothetical protein
MYAIDNNKKIIVLIFLKRKERRKSIEFYCIDFLEKEGKKKTIIIGGVS